MVSSPDARRVRKHPDERRAEILAAAAEIALAEGLEGITLRAVAERIGVRPGLITHYFPSAEDLVIAAFVRAAEGERETTHPANGAPLERIATFVRDMQAPSSDPLSKLWLNARHLSRFTPALAEAVHEQEQLNVSSLLAIIEAAVADGSVHCNDPLAACVRILIAIDGHGAYVNDTGGFAHEAYERFVADAAEWALGLAPGTLTS
ncbi:TetR family transcriptional regulator [Agromyces sp. CFH 90414]|uniref:TetR family transcriptional regulator n=1 Tax=Agromyces agglutinans TaxID=2662258 RepID=A0A6I2FA65_9MICO|nr:TetR/AcrR family transcriptional regulator [Agromyces agglutinans]MRG59276.1 TetR family transcriptional regulator [Agromyces agglutinans]